MEKEPKRKKTVRAQKTERKAVKKAKPVAKKQTRAAKSATSKKKISAPKPAANKQKTTKKKALKKAKSPVKKKVATKKVSTKKTTKMAEKPVKAKVTAKRVSAKQKAIAVKKPETNELVKAKREISAERMHPVIPRKILPMEYGEDKVTLMTVDPWKLFAYWEIKKSTVSRIRGTLVIRVYDVTGISNFDGKNAGIVFDIPIFGRIGDSYIGAGPGRDFIIDIGIISQSKVFIMFARSNRVSTPALKVSEKEGAVPSEIFESAPRVGY